LWLVVAAIGSLPIAAASAVVQFAAPAGDLPTQHVRNAVFDAILPSGRVVTPFGTSVVTGTNALGVTLTPDGRFAVVSNDDARAGSARSFVDPQVSAGYSLAVVDTATMRVVNRFSAPGETYFAGVAAVPDPRVAGQTLVFAAGGASGCIDVFDLDAQGRLMPDARHVIPIAAPLLAAGLASSSFPGTLVASRDGGRIYVVDEGGDAVAAINVRSRAVSGATVAVGFAPFGAALAGDELLVSNEGFRSADPLRASSLSLVALTRGGDVAREGAAAVPMDSAPDGLRIVGGAHPSAIAVTPDGAYAFVAMTNVDRIATVALRAPAHVVGGTELRLFDRGPYGTQPAAMVLSHDGTRLYVALAGLDAIAVLDSRDPLHVHRLGLLPTGWFPSALVLSADDRTLYALNTNGFGHDGDTLRAVATAGVGTVWSTLQKIDLASVSLNATTALALKDTREVREAPPHYPHQLRNVVVLVEEDQTFDAVLGDLGYGPADPRYLRFGAAVTPNVHALARRFALAGNLFADSPDRVAAHAVLADGMTTAYAQRVLFVTSPSDVGETVDAAPRAGSIFNNLARHELSFRDYGDCVPVVAGGSASPEPSVLAGQVDMNYPGWDVDIDNERRANEFIHDYGRLVAAHRQPRYAQVWLPAMDHSTGAASAAGVADADRALGTIVAYLSRLRSWRQTVVFIVPADTQDADDHVDADRTYAIVVSPYAKPHYVGMRHLSTASVLKTAEALLSLPPLNLSDLLASDMSDFFTPHADPRPYVSVNLPSVDARRPSTASARPEP
jgi:YVTN family beta-propeller protein